MKVRLGRLAILLALIGGLLIPLGGIPPASASPGAHHKPLHLHIGRRWPRAKLPARLTPAARLLWRSTRSARVRPRIIGGSDASQGQWGYMAFIMYFDSAGNAQFSCSGTLVSANVVLTAGHCAADETTGAPLDPSGYAVVTGAVDWTDTTNRQVSAVSQVMLDPNFNPSGPTNDAALLVLSAPLHNPPISLWASGSLSAGTPAWIAGWGMTYLGQPFGSPTVLQWAPTVVQNITYCQQQAPTGYPYDSSSALCAVNAPTADTAVCSGDSGGPLLANDASGNAIEIGVTSVGPADCGTQTADYYTAILPIEPWIENEARAVAPSSSSPTSPPSAPAPSAPSTPGTGSSAGPTPTQLPTMAFADGRSYVRQVLTHVFARFRHAHASQLSCTRLSRTRVKCGFTFWSGPNDYYGNVTVSYTTGNGGTTYWTDQYKTWWVNDHCAFHTNHRNSCATHPHSGSW